MGKSKAFVASGFGEFFLLLVVQDLSLWTPLLAVVLLKATFDLLAFLKGLLGNMFFFWLFSRLLKQI